MSARAVVSAREEAKAFQEALESVSRFRRGRRRRLERSLEEAVEREREAVATLGGSSNGKVSP